MIVTKTVMITTFMQESDRTTLPGEREGGNRDGRVQNGGKENEMTDQETHKE